MHIITPNNRTNPFGFPINATTPVAPQQVQSVVNPPAREFGIQDVSGCGDVNEVMQHIGIVGDYTKENIDHVCRGYSLIRDDRGTPLSIVNSSWDLLQPVETFAFMDALKTQLNFRYTRAGFTHGGNQLFIEAKMGVMEVKPRHQWQVGDIIEKRLCARTSFGYPAIATKLMEEFYRLWCKNGCGRWIKAGAEATNISVRHTRNQRQIIGAEIDRATGIKNVFMHTQSDINTMAHTTCTRAQFELINNIVTPNDTTRGDNVRALIADQFHNEDLGTFGATAWDAFNAFTAYQNHYRVARNTKTASSNENRHHAINNPSFVRKVRNAIEQVVGV